MAVTKICVSIDSDVLKQIDEARGLVPRSTYISDRMCKIAETEKKNKR